MLCIHNSLSGNLEPFRPMVPGKVRMYVCGITVYDYCHIGHMRMMVAFDVVQRYLRYQGYAVTFVRNITDIDDKIISRAAENGESHRRADRAFHPGHERRRRRHGHRAPGPRAARHAVPCRRSSRSSRR